MNIYAALSVKVFFLFLFRVFLVLLRHGSITGATGQWKAIQPTLPLPKTRNFFNLFDHTLSWVVWSPRLQHLCEVAMLCPRSEPCSDQSKTHATSWAHPNEDEVDIKYVCNNKSKQKQRKSGRAIHPDRCLEPIESIQVSVQPRTRLKKYQPQSRLWQSREELRLL